MGDSCCCVDVAESVDIVTEKIVTARKTHVCGECGKEAIKESIMGEFEVGDRFQGNGGQWYEVVKISYQGDIMWAKKVDSGHFRFKRDGTMLEERKEK